MNTNLESTTELAQLVRQFTPEARALSGLQVTDGFVSFQWRGTQFVAKKSLEVFEVKGKDLLVTGASLLIQSAFLQATRQIRVVQAVTQTINDVKGMLDDKNQVAKGLELLQSVKSTLRKMCVQKQAAQNSHDASLQKRPACVPA